MATPRTLPQPGERDTINTTLWLPLTSIVPYPRNPRKNQQAVQKLAGSLLEYGWQQPLLVDTNHVIVVGHRRYFAALHIQDHKLAEGFDKAPVWVASQLSEAQIQAYRIMDNRAHEDSFWDYELLQVELQELQQASLDLTLTGFESRELDRLINEAEWNEIEHGSDVGDGRMTRTELPAAILRVVMRVPAEHKEALIQWVDEHCPKEYGVEWD